MLKSMLYIYLIIPFVIFTQGIAANEIYSLKQELNGEQIVEGEQRVKGEVRVQLTIVYPPRSGKIELNSISLREFPFDGIYFEDVPISVGVTENQGFQFSHWETNRGELNPASTNQTFLPLNGDSLTAVFTGNSTFSALDVFPNPTSSSATVRFVNEKKGRVSVYLNSLDGRTKLELMNRVIQSGSHNLALQLPDVEGIFLLTVNTETSTNSQKLVIVKTK